MLTFSDFILCESVRDDILRDGGQRIEKFLTHVNSGSSPEDWLETLEAFDPTNSGSQKRNQGLKWIVTQVLSASDEGMNIGGSSGREYTFNQLAIITNALRKFKEVRQKLPKSDINQYKDYDELVEAIKKYEKQRRDAELKAALREDGARPIFQEDGITIISPTNYQMARELAVPGNQWCVASTSASQWFPDYTSYSEMDDGEMPLYYITFDDDVSLGRGDGRHFAWAIGGDDGPRDNTDALISSKMLRNAMGEDAWQAMMDDNDSFGGHRELGRLSTRKEEEPPSMERRVERAFTAFDTIEEIGDALISLLDEEEGAAENEIFNFEQYATDKKSYADVILYIVRERPDFYNVFFTIMGSWMKYGIGDKNYVFHDFIQGALEIDDIKEEIHDSIENENVVFRAVKLYTNRSPWDIMTEFVNAVSGGMDADAVVNMTTSLLYITLSNDSVTMYHQKDIKEFIHTLLSLGADVNWYQKSTDNGIPRGNALDIINFKKRAVRGVVFSDDTIEKIKSDTVFDFKYYVDARNEKPDVTLEDAIENSKNSGSTIKTPSDALTYISSTIKEPHDADVFHIEKRLIDMGADPLAQTNVFSTVKDTPAITNLLKQIGNVLVYRFNLSPTVKNAAVEMLKFLYKNYRADFDGALENHLLQGLRGVIKQHLQVEDDE